MSRMAPLKSGISLNCTIVSDTHIDIKHPFPFIPKKLLKCALVNSKKSKSPVDAFIIIGDTTSRGSKINWDMTKEVFSGVPDPAKNILIAIGNHDTWSDEGAEDAQNRYLEYSNGIMGSDNKKPYFSSVINGYHLIFLGGEGDSGCGALISDEQVQWFRDEMAEAGKSGKPIFVFCHQSLNQKHGLPRTFDKSECDTGPMDGGIGIKSDEIETIMKNYDKVFYFSGHSHMGISGEETYEREKYASFEKEGNLTLINLPSLACGNHHGENNSLGSGIQMEVYGNEVFLRPRVYKNSRWIKNVKIKQGKPYYFE